MYQIKMSIFNKHTNQLPANGYSVPTGQQLGYTQPEYDGNSRPIQGYGGSIFSDPHIETDKVIKKLDELLH